MSAMDIYILTVSNTSYIKVLFTNKISNINKNTFSAIISHERQTIIITSLGLIMQYEYY